MKDDPRKEVRDIFQKISDKGWIVMDFAQLQFVTEQVYEGKGSNLGFTHTTLFYMTNDIKGGKGSLIRIVKEVYRSDPGCLTLPKNGPMTRTFDKFIMRGFDHGLFQRIGNQYYLTEGIES